MTHGSTHVQFLLFYLCSLNSVSAMEIGKKGGGGGLHRCMQMCAYLIRSLPRASWTPFGSSLPTPTHPVSYLVLLTTLSGHVPSVFPQLLCASPVWLTWPTLWLVLGLFLSGQNVCVCVCVCACVCACVCVHVCMVVHDMLHIHRIAQECLSVLAQWIHQ